MRRVEHVSAGDAGSVTMGAVRVAGRMTLEVVVHAAVLRAVPWYRGGMGVAILVNPYGGGVLEIDRAGPNGPYRLRARAANRLDKLPPVQLRVPALPDMDGEERAAEPVAYETFPAMLRLTLPIWARRTAQPRVLDRVGAGA